MERDDDWQTACLKGGDCALEVLHLSVHFGQCRLTTRCLFNLKACLAASRPFLPARVDWASATAMSVVLWGERKDVQSRPAVKYFSSDEARTMTRYCASNSTASMVFLSSPHILRSEPEDRLPRGRLTRRGKR